MANDHIRTAIKAARKGRHHQHKVGAAIVRGGSIISQGHNFSHVHAEETAINRAWPTNICGATMMVARVRRDGSVGIAMPCEDCMKLLIASGIKKVVYTNSDGSTHTIRLRRGPDA